MVSSLAISGMIVSLCIAVGLPVFLVVYFKRWKGAYVSTAFVGAGLFIVFALMLEQMLHAFVSASMAAAFNDPAFRIVYSCLAAGVFEETGRFFGIWLLNHKQKVPEVYDAMMYGSGHGGIEAILLAGIACTGNLITASNLNANGASYFTEGLSGEQLDNVNQMIGTLTQTPAGEFFLVGFERIVAILLHIALSVIIWMAVTGRLSTVWYAFAVLLHAVSNSPAGLYQTGIVTNVWLAEVLTLVASVLVTCLAFYLYRRFGKNQPQNHVVRTMQKS